MKSDAVHCPVYTAVGLCSQDQLLVQALLLLALALNCWWSNDTFLTAKKALKLIFCFCFISDYFKKSDSVHCCLAVQSRSIAFASLIVACIGFELLVIKQSFFPCCWKTSPKGFSASKCDVGNWIFSKSYKFFEEFCWRNFFWWNFLRGFFGRIFLGGILCLH